MATIKCPTPGCPAANFQIVPFNGTRIIVCEHGHVISTDNSQELGSLANGIAATQSGIDAIIEHIKWLKGDVEGLKKAVKKLSNED